MRGDTFTGGSLSDFNLTGLTIGSPQVCGAIRLVPLLRDASLITGDLRLALRQYSENAAFVDVPGGVYATYVPHGLVLRWTNDGEPVAAWGTQLKSGRRDGRTLDFGFASIRLMQRMVKREAPDQVRLLPLHLAMEGFLGLFFGGPDIAWAEYSRRVYRTGISPRGEGAVPGAAIVGLAEALRVFEIAEGQVGVLLFVADALASVFVVPHPDDYRALHESLLRDFYGDLMAQYALLYASTAPALATAKAADVHTVADLRQALARMRGDWSRFGETLAAGLLAGRELKSQTVREMGAFRLERFMTGLDPTYENHIGEVIVRKETGETLYAKSFRLSAAQTKRAYFLSQLAHYEWNVAATAAALNVEPADLILRIEKAGFDYLFTPEVKAAARKARGLRGNAVL